MTSVHHPSRFAVSAVWIDFQLNETPIDMDNDRSLICISFMDAASCYLLGTELISAAKTEPSPKQARDMLTAAGAKTNANSREPSFCPQASFRAP